MGDRRPPSTLPAGLHPVWRLLREADEAAPSRRALASLLGVSTQTLQRLLVRGDLPDFASRATTREIRSWTRTLTRLALHFGQDPRAWVEGAGIRWDPEIAAAAAAASDSFRERRRARGGKRPAPGPGEERFARLGPRVVRVGIAELGPFSRPLFLPGGSFLEAYARRLLGAVNPAWGVGARAGETAEQVDALAAPSPALDLAVGVPETVRERWRGIEFLEIPGWRIWLTAGWVRVAGEKSPDISWEDILSPRLAPGVRLVALEGGTAHLFLGGQCGWEEDRLILVGGAPPGALARSLVAERKRDARSALVFVTDEGHFERVAATMRGAAPGTAHGTAPGSEARDGLVEILEGRDLAPSYPLSTAVAAASPARAWPPGGWGEALGAARDQELFGSARTATARLYAELLAAMTLAGPRPAPAHVSPRRGWRLGLFPQAGDAFRDDLLRHLRHRLATGLPGVTPVETHAGAAEQAGALLPEAWQARWRLVAGGEPAAEAALCRSCSVSLRENQGVSDVYCRYCSDESGTLKPRDEVQRLIAGWLQGWQEGVTAEEAARRAARFMEAMPAWARHSRH